MSWLDLAKESNGEPFTVARARMNLTRKINLTSWPLTVLSTSRGREDKLTICSSVRPPSLSRSVFKCLRKSTTWPFQQSMVSSLCALHTVRAQFSEPRPNLLLLGYITITHFDFHKTSHFIHHGHLTSINAVALLETVFLNTETFKHEHFIIIS
jgi:hypothetical protein